MARQFRRLQRSLTSAILLAATVLVTNLSAQENDCCSCKVRGTATLSNLQLPCVFDYPATWKSAVAADGLMVSGLAGIQSCDTICKNGTPAMTVSYGTTPDSNAETMEQIWTQVMPVVGKARCGDGTVTFFSPPGAEATGLLGGIKFYVKVNGKKYGGAATFTCGEPGGWLALRKLFIDSFRDNPESSFGQQ